MKQIIPQPSPEILTARLINDLTERGTGIEGLQDMNEAELFARYGGRFDCPNRTTRQLLDADKDRLSEIEQELASLLGDAQDKDEVDLSDPIRVKEYLDRFVEGQEDPKKAISVALVNYLQHNIRSGVLLMGPSGSGKTYMLEILAKKAGIPVVKKSLANVTTEGFKGQNLSEGLEDLLGVEQGILFLDEFDKVAHNDDFNGFGPQLQNELLAYFTGEKIKLANVQPKSPDLDDVSEGDNREEQLIPKLPGKESKGPSVRIYNTVRDIQVNNNQNNLVKQYLDSLFQYFRDKGVQTELRDLTSSFEEMPEGVANALSPYRYGGVRQGLRGEPVSNDEYLEFDEYLESSRRRQDSLGADSADLELQYIPGVGQFCNFVVEFNGKFLVNPRRGQLDRLIEQGFDVLEAEKASDSAPKEGVKREMQKKKNEPTNVVDLGKILVVAAGAFHGTKSSPSLYKIIQKRLGGNTCRLEETELLRNVEDSDLIEYGLKPELVGRLQSRTVLAPHSVEGLYRILKYNEDSPLDRIKAVFDEIGVTLHFDDPALLLLAQYAHEGIGVRGIHKALDQLTRDLSFERKKYGGRDIVLTRSDLEQKLRKHVEFEKRDSYEVDWFNINSIIGYLNLFVPEQEEAKVEMAKAFHLYHLRANAQSDLELPLANVLLVGPSGAGKTYMVNLLAKKAGLPIASTNATGKVPEGYTGTPLAEVFEQFSKTQDKGIVYIDEADKVLLEVSNPLNNEFIGFLENGEVRGRQTRNYLFIMSGACQGIYKAKKSRGESGEITKEDLIAYGVREEILGRVPILVNIRPPTLETTVKVLKGPDSVVTQYANYFSTQSYTLDLEEGVIELIAREALKSNLGYRQLKTVCSKLFGEYMVNLQKYVKDDRVKVSVQDAQRVLGGIK